MVFKLFKYKNTKSFQLGVKGKNIIMDSKSGYSGAGRGVHKKYKDKNLYESLSAYGVGFHRHNSEIDQMLKKYTKKKLGFNFTPHLTPMFRGILSTIYIDLEKGTTQSKIIKTLMNFYKRDDFIKILKHPESSLIKQYMALLGAENVILKFETDAIRSIAKIAAEVNTKMENIGARRLHTVMTTLLDDYMFNESSGRKKTITITKRLVEKKLNNIVSDQDLSKYIL